MFGGSTLVRLIPDHVLPRRHLAGCGVDMRAESLRRLIALYREYLRVGTDLERAGIYLQRIREAESELATIERQTTEKES